MISQFDLSAYLVVSFFNDRKIPKIPIKKRCCIEMHTLKPRWEAELRFAEIIYLPPAAPLDYLYLLRMIAQARRQLEQSA